MESSSEPQEAVKNKPQWNVIECAKYHSHKLVTGVNFVWLIESGALSQYKSYLSRYGDFQYEDKMIIRQSYLYNVNPYAGKVVQSGHHSHESGPNGPATWAGPYGPSKYYGILWYVAVIYGMETDRFVSRITIIQVICHHRHFSQ